jgi:transposase
MTRALSDDLRKRVIAAVDSGMSRRAAAERYGVGVSTAIKWVRCWRETGRWTARRSGGDVRSHRIDAFRDEILVLVETAPDMTLAEIAGHLKRTHGVQLALSTVFRFFRRHGVTYKKRRRTLESRIAPT